jgi:chromosome condensin MukBEF complex kleisin-like MukF subunit
MPATLTIRDETVGGELPREWVMDILTERLTVRELIRSRVYQEVQDYNQKQGQTFLGLVQPDEAEKTLNGWKLKKPRLLDWKRQFELALAAFERSQILILINDRQAESLDQEFVIEPATTVTFLRLTMLVGG